MWRDRVLGRVEGASKPFSVEKSDPRSFSTGCVGWTARPLEKVGIQWTLLQQRKKTRFRLRSERGLFDPHMRPLEE